MIMRYHLFKHFPIRENYARMAHRLQWRRARRRHCRLTPQSHRYKIARHLHNRSAQGAHTNSLLNALVNPTHNNSANLGTVNLQSWKNMVC